MDINLERDFLPKVDERLHRATKFEREAQQFHSQGAIDKAFASYDKAAGLYRDAGEHFKAALCFAAAATCWNIHTGWQPLKNAATRSHAAAGEAYKARNYQYAASLFRDATMLYEKEGDYDNYLVCYLAAKRTARVSYREIALSRAVDEGILAESSSSLLDRFRNVVRYALNLLDDLIWGYGMLPFRMFGIILAAVISCALIYTSATHHVSVNGAVHGISLVEGIYFSASTFSTVGYGDYLPLGWLRMVAVLEALSGIILMPLFLVALTRRYLRLGR